MGKEAVRRADRRIDQLRDVYQRHGKVFRVAWVAAGFVVVLAGVAMIVVPGPVTVVVPAGLVMLSVVFGWARSALLKSVDAGVEAKEVVDEASPAVKVLAVAMLVALGAAALTLLLVL